jgi:4a-hydroxytetrahydrobiopterin dehydratase
MTMTDLDHTLAALPRTRTELASLDVQQSPDALLGERALAALLPLLMGWAVDGHHLKQDFRFAGFHDTMAFVNAVAWIAHRGDHHPDLTVGYNRCGMQWSTHSAGGLTLKDFICAAQVDALQCKKA